MINVIFTYKATAELPKQLQSIIDEIQFVEIPEMNRIEEILSEDLILVTMPYQATVSESIFTNLNNSLSKYGELNIIGKWDDMGEIIEFDLHKYRDALKLVNQYEEVVLINGIDYTGKEDEFQPKQQKDKDENPLEVNGMPLYEEVIIQRFQKQKNSKKPTLAEAKKTHVNVFNSNFKRKLQ